jgi:hypothetical protein
MLKINVLEKKLVFISSSCCVIFWRKQTDSNENKNMFIWENENEINVNETAIEKNVKKWLKFCKFPKNIYIIEQKEIRKEVCKQVVKNWTFRGKHGKKLNRNALY